MKKLYIYILLMFVTFGVTAKGQWTLQGQVYTVDTLYHAKIGPGTTQTSVALSGPSLLKVYYTTTDLTAPYLDVRVVQANNSISGKKAVSAMAKANDNEGEQYISGVNADFFGTYPIGSTVVNKELYYIGSEGWTQWSMESDNKMHIGTLTFSGTIKKTDGSSFDITNINATRYENNLIIYSSRFGTNTKTNQYGTEVTLVPVESDGVLSIGSPVKMMVTCTPSSTGSMAIPSNGYVLSGHGTGSTFVSSLTENEIIEVTYTAVDGNGVSIVPEQSVGGCPVILQDGEVLNTEGAIDHLTALNPRTAIGYDESGTKLYMLVVDGRRAGVSVGCVSKVLADIMREVGCYDAMNFDGGGSSTLYVKDFGVVNQPSEGTERTVSNGVYIVAESPSDTEIASIEFIDWGKTLPKYGLYSPKFYGFNKYGVLVDKDVQGVVLSCSSELGEIINDGTSLLASGAGSHLLTASFNGSTATMPVNVDGGSIPVFRTDTLVADSFHDMKMEVVAIVGEEEMLLDNSALKWSSDDTSVATVDENGVIKGIADGVTTIYGSVGDFSGKVDVIVEIPTKRYLPIDPVVDVSTWTITGSRIENESIVKLDDHGIEVNYTTTASKRVYVTISKDIITWSRPDSLLIEINPGTAKVKTIDIYAVNPNNPDEEFVYTLSPNFVSDTLNRYLIPLTEWSDISKIDAFPLIFKRMEISPIDASGTQVSLKIKKMEWVYNAVPADASGVENVIKSKGELKLSPNPVNSGDVVRLNVFEPVDYIVYGVDGSVVTKGIGTEISTSGMSEGVYIVTVIQNGERKSTRLLVK